MPIITDLASFIDIHQEQRRKLDNYLWIPKRNYQTLDQRLADQLDRKQRRYLHANNLDARIEYVQVALAHINSWVDGAEGDSDLLKVTLIPDNFAVDLADAPEFDVQSIKGWTSEVLDGIDFVGVVEAAYFPTWRSGQPTISWHVHLLTKGSRVRQVALVLRPVRTDYKSLVPGIKAALIARLPRAELDRWVMYKNKYPLTTYRPYPVKADRIDAETGECLKVPTGRFKISKHPLRPGDIVRMCRTLENQTLDGLIFGGGTGVAVVEAITSEVLRPLRDEEGRAAANRERLEMQRQRRAKGKREPRRGK